MKEKSLTWANVLGYSSINFLGSGSQTLSSAWLMIFYTSMCGIEAVQAGLIFTIARLIDAVGNPVMGYISDNFGRTKLGKKFGRRKFFIFLGIPGILILYPTLWTVGHSFTFYLIFNMLFEMMFTVVIVSSSTLPAEMTQDSGEKSKLIAGQQYCGILAGTIATFIPGFLFQQFGDNNPQAFFLTGLIYAIIIAVALSVVCKFTFERNDHNYEETDGNNETGIIGIFMKMFTDVFSSLKIRSFKLHAAMMLLIGIYKNLVSGIFSYFVIYVLFLNKSVTSYITSFTIMGSFLALACYIALAYKFGGPKTFRISAVVIFASLIGYFTLTKFVGSQYIIVLTVICALISTIGRAGADYVPTFQLTFMADIDEAVTLERREGIFSGVNGLLSKVASATEGFLLGIVLTAFGFVKNSEVQTQSAINGVLILTIIVPAIFIIIAWIVSKKLKLTGKNHKLLVDEVNRIKAGGSKADVTPEAKKAIEELTGWKYEQCFGNNDIAYYQNITA